MKKSAMSLGMMMIAAAMALPAFAAQQHEHAGKGHMMAQYTEPCCPVACEKGEQARPDGIPTDPARNEVPSAALRG